MPELDPAGDEDHPPPVASCCKVGALGTGGGGGGAGCPNGFLELLPVPVLCDTTPVMGALSDLIGVEEGRWIEPPNMLVFGG